MMTAAQRKAKQRQRDKLAGWHEMRVKVAAEHAQTVREFVASLPPPKPPTDPRQISMIEALDRAIDDDESGDASRQASLF